MSLFGPAPVLPRLHRVSQREKAHPIAAENRDDSES